MNKFYRRLKKYTQITVQILMFLLAAVALYLILPGEPKFKYEYQKSFPWKHENLVAPFDFAILKTAKELDDERQEQISKIIPYFTCDTSIANANIKKLREDMQLSSNIKDVQKQNVIDILSHELKKMYDAGILQFSIDSYTELSGKSEIRKITGNSVTRISTQALYSEKQAYNTLNTIKQELDKSLGSLDWLNAYPLDRYIAANLTYDFETTQKEIDEATQNISLSRGMVRLGERIILEGEVVDSEKYQILESLKASYEKERGNDFNRYMVALGKSLFILVMLGLIFVFLYIYRRDILVHLNRLIFLLLLITFTVFIAQIIDAIPNLNIYIVPFAILPIVVRTFFDSRTAIFTLFITTLLIGFYAPNNYEFILLQVSAGVVSVFSLNKMHRRVHLVLAAIWVFLTYAIVYTALTLIHEGTLMLMNLSMLKWFVFSSVLIMLVYILVYIFEKLFGFISDVTLIEISDSNQPLLRKLAEEAPGTFQHSMQIANLAEEVILKIGGNPFLVRAGALYHDIGKIARPNFFIENQAAGMNPHDRIDNMKSAEVIIDHVKNGVKMAQKHKLPAPIIEFIATHHGTTKAKYFYLKHKEEHPDSDVNEDQFMYPGPLPKSKEASVVMLVDGIEAASRSMKEKTHQNLQELINRMIDQKIDDKQLDNSELTFSDIEIIKATLLDKLINIYHVRIEYPEDKRLKK
ncbi:HD family phosphohydrolase [Maribellus sediminis]|uniref:HD family phosphohydrolase n=1 Tax=Maribellus sediminis TaxID=2696285 RepID=UPI001431E05A|nr:HDIG domain-containing metalloprotein [Maribellus sediminis]